jgi:RimJ/RimL family protein N-acetyltransferase
MHRVPPPTARLQFRSWRPDDLELARGLWGDPRVTALISRAPFTAAELQTRLAAEIACEHTHDLQYWPIFLRTTGAPAGCCGLRPHDPARGSLELGFHLRPAVWGQGLATEAARAVIHFAFTQLAAAALFAGHHPQNLASHNVLTKLGFRRTHSELYPATGLHHPSYCLTAADTNDS